ncbi:copper radical oxidase [Lepidopterella palustris CBS 459.81]|uniref:Copper radical oxidase n=1 Tax=Lepidopterella palustris CBS 459.81 TaxID=1314670 RepID=A0A8E2E5X1_9PEZI|nr:copper radical oxidase [Lepidopterella palustris CBS 459.81]
MAPTFVHSALSGLLLISTATIVSAGALEKRILVPRVLTPPAKPATNWTYLGCYTDSVGARSLTGAAYNSGTAMTDEACVSFCISKNMIYAGTEYAGECYCGNSIASTGTPAASTDCNMACNGNAAEPCGGPNRLTVFNTTAPAGPVGPFVNPGVNGYHSLGCYTDSVGARTLATGVQTTGGQGALTVALCTSACAAGGYTYAGVEYASECYCSNTIASTGTSATLTDCNMVCNGNSTEYCGGPNRLNLYSNLQAPVGWKSLGCYTDSVNGRTLTVPEYPGTMTIELCTSTCKTAGYIYAGVEYGGECYCGNAFANGGGPAPDGSAGCNMPCAGNGQETCGGSNRLNVFQQSGTTASTTSAAPASSTVATSTAVGSGSATGLPKGWTYQGCYIDGANGRILQTQEPDSSTNTIEQCTATCIGLGYSVSGMEYGVNCFCDNFLRNGGTLTSDTDCNMVCPGNTAEKCGAGNRMSIYSNATLQVYQPPAPQKTNLTGNWTYQGCLLDNAETRTFPYQLILPNNNTANNCLQSCQKFGYGAGGMEYSDECYCGDVANIAAAGATLMPESDCNSVCSGNSSYICGGGDRISYYKWTGTPLNSWNFATGNAAGQYQFLIGGVIVPLIATPGINGKVTFLEKYGTGPPNTTGAYELDLKQLNNFTGAWRPMHVKSDVFCSGGLTLPDKAGRQINVGGWANDATYGIRLYAPDGTPGVWGKNDWQENVNEVSLQAGRWYPTPMIMANGSILVVGGEQGSNGAPVPSLELLPKVGPVVYCDWLDRTDPYNLYPFLAVLPSGGIFVAYYNEARILDEVTLLTKKVLPNIPGAVNDFLGGRTYPFEGTAVLMPQHAPYTDHLVVMLCGGSIPGPEFALDNCVFTAPEDTNPVWTVERMPSKRVISCMTALPDGTYLILNGGQQGRAGFGLCTEPNHNAILYDPSKPVNNRMTSMANTTIDRLYHSEAVLIDDGRVLVSGSDPEDVRFVQEYRVEVFIPPYLMGSPAQPVVTIAATSKDWAYGQSYSIGVSSAPSKISLMGAVSSTHGNSMGQRTIFPAFSCSGLSCTVTAPPNAHVCPPGWFQLFMLDANGVPSVAQWVRIGGDPASLGNWPNFPDFQPLPGV